METLQISWVFLENLWFISDDEMEDIIKSGEKPKAVLNSDPEKGVLGSLSELKARPILAAPTA